MGILLDVSRIHCHFGKICKLPTQLTNYARGKKQRNTSAAAV